MKPPERSCQIGGCALMDATWAAVGKDSLADVIGALRPVLAAAVPGLGGQVAAGALIGAFTREYRCEQPGDAEELARISDVTGNGLVNLVRAGAIPPRDALPVGLALLAALAQLCRSDSASILQHVLGVPR